MPRRSRKDEVLAAATACFADLGYDKTRTRDIAARAGMSEASIYRHFNSLDDLALQVYSANLAEYASLIETAVGANGPGHAELTASLALNELGLATNAPELAPHSPARAQHSPELALREVVRATLARYRSGRESFVATLIRVPSFMPNLPAGTRYPLELIEAVVVQGQHDGSIRAGQPNLLASLFLGALLRPFLLAELAAPGAFDLFAEPAYDSTIEDASIGTLFPQPGP